MSRNSSVGGQSQSSEQDDNFFANIRNYLNYTSVHGLQYLGMKELSLYQRTIWSVLCILALTGTISVSLVLAGKFQESLLSTVVETTNYHVSEIPFPSITLCHNLRVDFDKLDKGVERFLPNGTEQSKRTFLALLRSFEILDFGSFDELQDLKFSSDFNISTLEHLNLEEVAQFMSHSCDDLFKRCWWRNRYLNCCDIFTVQKGEYGFCFSFNSGSSAPSAEVNRSYAFPWRVSSFNEWSGLRVELNIRPSKFANESRPDGLLYIVHDPYEWPNIARFIPSGNTNAIQISAVSFYASPEVHNLPIELRQCVYVDPQSRLYTPSKYMHLQGLPYLRANCISECRQEYMFKYCNCSLGIFFNLYGQFPPCDIHGLMCLNTFNEIFNYEVPPKQSEYFDDQPGMECVCHPECARIEYQSVEGAYLAMTTQTNVSVTLDFHFKDAFLVRYRTDIVFGWLDLLVAFGGIAGLFMGCSLLSGAEIIYYFAAGFAGFVRLFKLKDKTAQAANKLDINVRQADSQWTRRRVNLMRGQGTLEGISKNNRMAFQESEFAYHKYYRRNAF